MGWMGVSVRHSTGSDVRAKVGGEFRRQEITRGELLGVALSVVLVSLAYALPPVLFQRFPVAYVYLVSEDGIAEWGSFAAWMGAFLVFSVVLVRRPALRTPGLLALAAASLFIAGEEISWGQRVFGLHSPAFFRAHNSQGELNLHNFVASRDYALGNLAIALWSLCASPLAMVSSRVRKALRYLTVPVIPPYLVPWFAVALAYLTSSGIGLEIRTSASLCLSELGEFYLGIGVLLLAIHFACGGGRHGHGEGVALVMGGFAASFALVFGLVAARVAADEGALRMRLHQFALVVYPQQGDDGNALALLDYIESHPSFMDYGTNVYSWNLGTTVEHAALLRRVGRDEQARTLLTTALEQGDRTGSAAAHDAGAMRRRGAILQMLGRDEEAASAFQAAIAWDEARLRSVRGVDAEARVRWSLAKTYAQMKADDAAVREGKAAYDRTPDGALHKVIRNWARDVLSEEF